jgi:hypothetical protein
VKLKAFLAAFDPLGDTLELLGILLVPGKRDLPLGSSLNVP